jgi:hypothetical protein
VPHQAFDAQAPTVELADIGVLRPPEDFVDFAPWAEPLEFMGDEGIDDRHGWAVKLQVLLRERAGDAKQWVIQAFAHEGIAYLKARAKTECYLEIEPRFAQGLVDLLDHPQLIRELKLLERRFRPGGKPSVDHPRGAHE